MTCPQNKVDSEKMFPFYKWLHKKGHIYHIYLVIATTIYQYNSEKNDIYQAFVHIIRSFWQCNLQIKSANSPTSGVY